MYDVLIIGGGVIGTSIARELSAYSLSLALLEKEEDVAMGTTKANSAIVHAGYDAVPGTLKAKTNLRGNEMFDQWSRELSFPFRRIGSLVLAFHPDDIPALEELCQRGLANGVKGLKVLTQQQVRDIEPALSDGVVGALYAPTGGICCPYEMTFALGENAAANGVDFFLGHTVTDITKEDNHFTVTTPSRIFQSRMVINAAGVYADTIHNMISQTPMEIIPRAGEYIVFDRTAGDYVNHTLFQLPTDMGKGVLVTPSVDGNLLIGPTATDLEDKSDTATTYWGRQSILKAAGLTLKEIPTHKIIHAFTGLRAHSPTGDFIIEPVPDVKGMIDVAAIESPGLTAAPAIAEMVVEMVGQQIALKKNPNSSPYRSAIPRFRELDNETRQSLISENPLYGHIVCRCETITEGEIVEAIHRPLGARNLDALKRRVRTGMGRCQGGFCSPIALEILSRELNLAPTDITKFGKGSQVLLGKNRQFSPQTTECVEGDVHE